MFDLRELELMFLDPTDLLINKINRFLISKKPHKCQSTPVFSENLQFFLTLFFSKRSFESLPFQAHGWRPCLIRIGVACEATTL